MNAALDKGMEIRSDLKAGRHPHRGILDRRAFFTHSA
jgi:hypothetical protein